MQHASSLHDGPRHGEAIMFASLMRMTCSVCAPSSMEQKEVEAAAMIMLTPKWGPWRAVDKSRPPISIGEPTPNACNVYAGRQHWFLISD
jgi:hypothetical protein